MAKIKQFYEELSLGPSVFFVAVILVGGILLQHLLKVKDFMKPVLLCISYLP